MTYACSCCPVPAHDDLLLLVVMRPVGRHPAECELPFGWSGPGRPNVDQTPATAPPGPCHMRLPLTAHATIPRPVPRPKVWGWPPTGMSYDADRTDPARHEVETAAHEAFGATCTSVALLTPGAHPLDALATAVNAATGHAAGVSGDDLCADPDALRRQTSQAGAGAVVIAVDQLEELFTLSNDEDERRCFVDALIGAWQDPASPVAVILALPADFDRRVASCPHL